MASPTKHPPPKPGTPEFDEYIEEQAQTAMDRALAMPLVRVFNAAMFFLAMFAAVMGIFNALAEGDWSELIWSLLRCVFPYGFMMLLFGYAAVYGKSPTRSPTPWLRDMLGGYRSKHTRSAAADKAERR